MKTLVSVAIATLSVAAIPALSHAQTVPELYGTLGYSGSRAEGADTGAVTGRLGAKLTPHFGVEGELSGGVKDDNIDSNGIRSNIEPTHQAALYGVGFLPVTPNIDLLARIGYGNTQYKTNVAGVEGKFDADSVNYGVGAQYKFDDKNGVRADYTRVNYDSNQFDDTDVWSLSYVRRY